MKSFRRAPIASLTPIAIIALGLLAGAARPIAAAAAEAKAPAAAPASVPASAPAASVDTRAKLAAMVKAAETFLGSLDEPRKAKAVFPFDSPNRTSWHYIPMPRTGLTLKEMTPEQRDAAEALLRTGLSGKGVSKVEQIMSLEPILREIETAAGDATAKTKRDPDMYYFAVYGEPSISKPWGWRIEGHHISLHFTMIDGEILATSPAFLGANPHEVMDGPQKGTRVLGAEDDLGRALLKSLTDAQRAEAIISPDAPPDIFTKNDRKAELEGPAKGLARGAMSEASRTALDKLIAEYITLLPPHWAEMRQARINALTPAQRDDIRFAWMGGPDKGQPNYYRVQAPTFLIEYDNTPNNANHSHVVWRDFNGDFGLDLLALHHRDDAAEAPAKP